MPAAGARMRVQVRPSGPVASRPADGAGTITAPRPPIATPQAAARVTPQQEPARAAPMAAPQTFAPETFAPETFARETFEPEALEPGPAAPPAVSGETVAPPPLPPSPAPAPTPTAMQLAEAAAESAGAAQFEAILEAVARSAATMEDLEPARPGPAAAPAPATARATPRPPLAAEEAELDFATDAEATPDSLTTDSVTKDSLVGEARPRSPEHPAPEHAMPEHATPEHAVPQADAGPRPEAMRAAEGSEPGGEAAAEVPAEDAGDKVRAILRGRTDAQPAAEPDAAERDARVRAAFMNRAPSRWQAWIVPGAAAAAVLLLFGILILARESIVRVLPGTAALYSALGFEGAGAVGAGLEFRDVTSRREWAGTDEVLIVRGVIANVSKDNVAVPPVRVALYDIDEYEVQSMTVPNAVHELGAGNTISFEARIPNPALKAQRIRVTFQAPGHRGAA